jgi:DNA-binding transcriptional LysR family regulator
MYTVAGLVLEGITMHRRHMDKNIPTELLRALVTVIDTGGFTRAADDLELKQSAISTQLKRLGNILGGDIFEKGRGLTLTKRGMLALSYARRMLGMNDELLSLAGRNPTHDQLIIGLPAWMDSQTLAAAFGRCKATSPDQKVVFKCERADVLQKDLNARSADIIYTCNAGDMPNTALCAGSSSCTGRNRRI